MASKCWLIITGLFLLPPSALHATEYHVAQNHAAADDSGRGTPERPFKTIGRAAALVRPGDVVRIHSGVYREKVTIAQSGTKEQPIRFEAAQGASVTITGADPLTGWAKEQDDSYSVPWPHELDQGDSRNPNPGGVEQVFVNQVLLRKAPGLKELAAGMFFIDSNRKRLHIRAGRNPDEGPAKLTVEGSTRSEIWVVTAACVHTRGLRFRYAANRGQQGMAQFRGKNAVVEDCIFEWSNSSGAFFWADDITVLRCTFQDNGQQGFSAYRADRLRLDGCTVQRNNVKGFPREWEAGGNKICSTRGAVLENSRFLRNHGSGVWFDISNVDCTVRNCLIADNEDAGIFYEISYSLRAHDNVIIGNGLAETKGAWGADGGICLSSSPGCVIERNLLVGNRQGFCFREQNRTTPPIDGAPGPEVAIWNHDEVIRDNFIADNRTAQVQGWFDIATERHWPRAMQTGQGKGGKAGEDVAAGNQAAKDGVPAGLSLEDLKITFEGNMYSLQPHQPFFIWGTNWKRKQEFRDLPSLTKALGFEGQRSRMLPPFPVDIARRDLRLPKDHPAFVSGAYPRGKVPDCLLGEEARLQEATARLQEAAAALQAAMARAKEAEAAEAKAQATLKESRRRLKDAVEKAVAAGLPLDGICPHCLGQKGAAVRSASLGTEVWEECRKCSGTGNDGADQTKNPGEKPPAETPAPPAAASEWETRLLSRLKQEIAAGRPARVNVAALGQAYRVTAIDAGGTLSLTSGAVSLTYAWSKLTTAERAGLAASMARDDDQESRCLAAHFLLKAGRRDKAYEVLGNEGTAQLETIKRLRVKINEDETALGAAKGLLRVAETDPGQANLDKARMELEKLKADLEKFRAALPSDNRPSQGEPK